MENQLFDNVHRTKNVETATGMKEVGEKASAVKLKPLPPGFPLPFDPDKYKAKTDKVAGGKRYIPLSALEAVGKIFLEGVPKYGEWNWKNGAGDKPYQMERWEHASRHLQLWAEGDRSEEHLAKVMWFCATHIELERIENETNQVGPIDLDDLFGKVRTLDATAPAYTFDSPVGYPDSVKQEGIVDTLKDMGREVGTAALLTGIQELIALLRKKDMVQRRNAVYTPPKDTADVPKKEKKTKAKRGVISEEGKERIAAAQKKRWAKVRREKKAQAKYDPRGVEGVVKGKRG